MSQQIDKGNSLKFIYIGFLQKLKTSMPFLIDKLNIYL